MGKSDLGLGKSDLGLGKSDLGLGKSDFGLGKSDLGLGKSDLGRLAVAVWLRSVQIIRRTICFFASDKRQRNSIL
ncbi:MAG: hypothetical protein LBO67_02060 [Spirochaetaceae bacterium]|nr:hypothetical protein [Spirochaetaceae bacterium]